MISVWFGFPRGKLNYDAVCEAFQYSIIPDMGNLPIFSQFFWCPFSSLKDMLVAFGYMASPKF